MDFVYIAAASFSGSTLLTFLLNSHPEVATIGEMKGDSMDVENYRCSCGEPIGQCRFWQRLVARIREDGMPFALDDVWTQSGFRIPGAPVANRVVRHRHRSEHPDRSHSIRDRETGTVDRPATKRDAGVRLLGSAYMARRQPAKAVEV